MEESTSQQMASQQMDIIMDPVTEASIPSNSEALPVADNAAPDDQAQAADVWQPPQYEEHPAGEEIRRQVEYYFSDENLPKDAHLLMKTGGAENLPVSVKHICGFPKMRRYKPYRSVVESLKKSTFLDIIDDKYIKRKVPLAVQPVVAPQKIKAAEEEEQKKKASKAPSDQPWLTKGMLKPTGFEEFFADVPVTPAVFQEELSLYDRDLTFETRIETAIQRYRARRKFHQDNARVFDRFMGYGGIESGPKPFGGSDVKDLADKDAADIAALTARHFVSDEIMTSDKWEVDFEGVAKGFLSCYIMRSLHSDGAKPEIARTTSLMRNFYNYLLHHDVCPEYKIQIESARKVCDLADVELFNVVMANEKLPGPFNTSVSALHGGALTGVYSDEQAWDGADMSQRTLQDCREIIMFALSANGSEQQYQRVSEVGNFETVYQEQISMEVCGIEMADDETRALYANARATKPFLATLGKLHCRRWTYPSAPRFDHSEEAMKRQQIEDTVTLWIEEEILRYCFVGMKVEGEVRELDIGVKWLDSIRAISPSFFEWLPNELHGMEKAMKAEEEAVERLGQADMGTLDKVDDPVNAESEAY